MEIYLWSITLAATFIIEILTPSALVSVWFFFGSLVALLAAFIGLSFWIQCLLFMVVSLACLFMIRPLAKKAMRGNIEATNIDRYIGQTFLLHENIEEEKEGIIVMNNIPWRAISANGDPIKAGKHVRVLSFAGSKVIVRSIEE